MNISTRYNRIFVSVIAGLILFICVLTVITVWQGPRIRSATLERSATTQPNQLLVVRANQTLHGVQAKDIRINPNVAFTATVKGSTIAIRFNERLNYATNYTLTVAAKKPMKHHFRTKPASLYYLGSHNNESAIKRYDVYSKNTATILSRKNISSFVVLQSGIIAVIKHSDNDYRILRIQKSGRVISELKLPYRGVIDVLRSSSDGQSFGLVLSHTVGDMTRNTLLVTKPGSYTLQVAKDPSNKPLNVINWFFSTDNSHAIAQDIDLNTQIVSLSTAQTNAFVGQHTALLGTSADSKQIIFRDQQNFVSYDRTTQKKQPIRIPLGSNHSISDLAPLRNASGFVVRSGLYQNSQSQQELSLYTKNIRTFFTVNTRDRLISTVNVSPNDQLAAVLMQNRASEDSKFSYQTNLVDIQSGKTITTIDGTDPQWDL